MAFTNRCRGLYSPSSTGLTNRMTLVSSKVKLELKEITQHFVKRFILLIKMFSHLSCLYVSSEHIVLPVSVLAPVGLHLLIGRRGTHVSIKESRHNEEMIGEDKSGVRGGVGSSRMMRESTERSQSIYTTRTTHHMS